MVPSGFVLTPGEDPVDLPITVRNSGGTASEPASAALDLPPGVRSVGPASSFAGGRLLRLDGAADQTVACPAGAGTVTCATTQGIAPGGTATFLFRVQADQEAMTGRILGKVDAGASVSVAIGLDVEVRPARDDLELLVHQWQHGFWEPRLDITATNTGGRAGELRLVVESDRHVTLVALWPGCERSWNRIACAVPLARGESFRLSVWGGRRAAPRGRGARLGDPRHGFQERRGADLDRPGDGDPHDAGAAGRDDDPRAADDHHPLDAADDHPDRADDDHDDHRAADDHDHAVDPVHRAVHADQAHHGTDDPADHDHAAARAANRAVPCCRGWRR